MQLASVLACCCCIGVLQRQHVAASPADDYDPSAESPRPRAKRTLTYPTPSTLLLIFGIGTPLQLERESVIVGAFAKMIYALPSNATDFTDPGGSGQQTKETRSRWSLYRTLGQLAELYGFGAAKACVMRSICEAAAAPFDARQGLLHQLLQTFLSPSSTAEPYEQYQDREYHAAELLGRGAAGEEQQQRPPRQCHALYPECRASLLDVFSTSARPTTSGIVAGAD